jgi:hypothetical protein
MQHELPPLTAKEIAVDHRMGRDRGLTDAESELKFTKQN